MNFYKKYETLNDIPEPFRRSRRAATPPFFTPPEPVLNETAIQSESVREKEQEAQPQPEPEITSQGVKQQSTDIHRGNQDLVFMLLMFMLLSE